MTFDPIDQMTQQDIDREWAKMFLENWNRAVKLWDNGQLFNCHTPWSTSLTTSTNHM